MEHTINDLCFTYFNDDKNARIEIRQIGFGYIDRFNVPNNLSKIAFKSECEQYYNERR